MHIIWIIMKWYLLWYLLCVMVLVMYAWIFERYFIRPDHKFGRAGWLTLTIMICSAIVTPHFMIKCIREYPKGKWQGF